MESPDSRRPRRSSGLLLNASPRTTEAQVLREALGRLSGVTRSITANIQCINGSLERILMDKADVEELERILMKFTSK
ncbi:hypothetical protein NDU88_005541 [Pleurodeles waltl]|uniref:Uncharacterized protein n=1 Tax=Pleurodeles waltl TaxID=8319 RepID=A0AAV7MYR6_PLEWA|nr:hypothetical protein NDU88_005541 [Pleurodeles waltl]